MTQTKEEKGVLRAFWEGFKEGWNGSSAQEEAPSLAREEVIEAADEWDIDDMPETTMTAEIIEPADEWDMPETVMAVEAPQEKHGLAAFFEGFRDGWNNPPPASEVEMANEEEPWLNPWLRKSWFDNDRKWEDEPLVLSDYDDRIWTDPGNPEVAHYLWSKGRNTF